MRQIRREGSDLVSMPITGTMGGTNLVESFSGDSVPKIDLNFTEILSSLNFEKLMDNSGDTDNKISIFAKDVKKHIEEKHGDKSQEILSSPIEKLLPEGTMNQSIVSVFPIVGLLPESFITENIKKPLNELIPPGSSINDLANK